MLALTFSQSYVITYIPAIIVGIIYISYWAHDEFMVPRVNGSEKIGKNLQI